MWKVLSAITRAFDVLLTPFAGMSPWVGLAIVSVVTGVIMLLIFGKTSNQKKIGETKDKLKAYIMEMWIFRNDTRVMLMSIGSVVRSNIQYLRHSLRPIVFILIPVLIIMVQLGIRYQSQPFMPGQEAVITVQLRDGALPSRTPIELSGPPGVHVLSPPLRLDAEGKVEWLLQARMPGTHELLFVVDDSDVVTKTFSVGPERAIAPLSRVHARAGTWDAFLYPVERPIPRSSIIESVTIDYPTRDLPFLGLNVNWLVAFFVVSLVAGFALKGVFGIEV